jgi:phasin family protein
MVHLMTDVKTKTAKPGATKAAPKAAPVKKVAVKAETKTTPAAAPKAPMAKLVSKIVTVDKTNIETGAKKMTQTVEQTTETVTAKAKDFFADMQVRAAEAAEKGKKLAADAVEYQKANLAAMVEAGKIVAQGAQDMGKTNLEFAKSNFADMQAAVKELAAVRTPTDFFKVQTELAKKAFDTAVSQGSKNTEATVKLVSDMFQPISNRIAVTTDLFKKAA